MTRTAGYRHQSIEAGVEAVKRLGLRHGFLAEATEDPRRFRSDVLRGYAAVVFLNTTGDILDEPQERALSEFVRWGGGFVGVHAAADTEHDWSWYGQLVGARFTRHGPVEPATVQVSDRTHPSTRHLPVRWSRRDEWYEYTDVAADLRVLAALEGVDGRPIAWCHLVDGGRSWYTGGGHTVESFSEPLFLEHVAGGILWAIGR